MKKQWGIILAALMVMVFMVMSGCGGGGSSGGANTGGGTASYSISGTITNGGAGLAGVAVTLSGSSAPVTTDSSGNYSFSSLQNGSYTVTPVLAGYTFAPATLAVTVNSENLTGKNFTATTVAAGSYGISGSITSGGAGLAGVTVSLSGSGSTAVTTDSNGNYSFTNAQNGSYTLTPSKSGYSFSPATQAVTVNSANVTGKNFTATASSSGTTTGVIKLQKTGQIACYDAAGSNIACSGTSQDGELQKGSVWPSPRFSDNANGTVTDSLTGLIWSKDANLMKTRDPSFMEGIEAKSNSGAVKWQPALDYVKKLNAESYLGFTDWRLPNVYELESLVNRAYPATASWLNTSGFNNVLSGIYWSSTTPAASNVLDGISAWCVNLGTSESRAYGKESTANNFFVWPVRSGQPGSIPLPKTGQTACFGNDGKIISCNGTGQDGEFQKGVAWPSPRFKENGNGTVTDNLTGLIWLKDANLLKTRDQSFDADETVGDGKVTWQHALDYIKKLNQDSYQGYSDWRLPNIIELHSLDHVSYIESYLLVYYELEGWVKDAGFINYQGNSGLKNYYWNSTTDASSPEKAGFKYVWSVRGGQ
jgi:hypothetical protein